MIKKNTSVQILIDKKIFIAQKKHYLFWVCSKKSLKQAFFYLAR